jgi:hypothetical protein
MQLRLGFRIGYFGSDQGVDFINGGWDRTSLKNNDDVRVG